MDYTLRLALSYYKTIAIINEPHQVYLVQHQVNDRFFVKKTLDVYNLSVYEYLKEHPVAGTPRLFDFYEEEGRLVIIEEFVSGTPLSDLLEKGTLKEDDALHYMIDLCEILERLHGANTPIIHRDIKPSNVMITCTNHAALLDFNAAKQYSQDAPEDTVLLGTRGYAAPEQYGFGSSSPQTDIYGMGIMLQEISPVFSEGQKSSLQSIIEKATKLNPADRYASITDFKLALCRLLPGYEEPAGSKDASWLPPGFRTKTPWKMILAIPTYLLILRLSFSLEVKDITGPKLLLNRMCCLGMLLFLIFGTANYQNIQSIIPLCKHSDPKIKVLGIILLDILIIAVFMAILVFGEALLS